MSQNICIYFSDTGGGHRSAADALESALRELIDRCPDKPDVSILKDAIAEKSHPLNRYFVELYNYLLRNHQPLMKYYYRLLHLLRPERGINLALTGNFFKKTLSEQSPSVVVSVHPMINHGTAHALKMNGLAGKVKLVCVITDPNQDLWRAWACNDCDLIVAPNDIVQEKLEDWGVEPNRIEIHGMSVNPAFLKPPTISRQEFLSSLGLVPETLTVCINAGWAGGGNMLKIYRALTQVERPLQVIFLCGHNNALYEEAMAAAADSDVCTAVLPFHDTMSDLMSSVDIMISKAGGLTTFEALARRLPLAFDMITEPMPQERGTVEMLLNENLAAPIHAPDDVVPIVETLLPAPNRADVQLPLAHNLNLTDTAVYTTAERILNMIGVTVPSAVPAETEEEFTDEAIYVKVS